MVDSDQVVSHLTTTADWQPCGKQDRFSVRALSSLRLCHGAHAHIVLRVTTNTKDLKQ
jgi:hypothetical protein